MPAPEPKQSSPANTIRMEAADTERLHKALDTIQEGGSSAGKAKRSFHRWPFRRTAVRVDMMQPGGQPTQLHYACRNLSNTGIGVLHSSYVHLKTPVVVYLPLLSGELIQAPGRVVRCQHVRGNIHEVGIQFDRPISPRDFIPIDPLRGNFTLENVDPARLSGSVLHIDDSAMDRRLIRHYLRETGLNVVGVESAAAALERAPEDFDIILCDDDLPDGTGQQLIEQLRSSAVQSPIILLTSGLSGASTPPTAGENLANAHLAKPFKQADLLRALAEFLLADPAGTDMGGAIYTTLSPDDETYSFVPEFLDELRKTAGALSQAISDNDLAAAKRLCFQVRGAAPSLGFGVLAEAAEGALEALGRAANLAEAGKQVRAVVFMCMRARAKDTDKPAAKPESKPEGKPEAKAA